MANSKHISQDEIQYIVDVESSKAQQEIHKLEKESSKLRSENKQRLNQMIQLEAQGKKNTSAYQALRKEYTDLPAPARYTTKRTASDGILPNAHEVQSLLPRCRQGAAHSTPPRGHAPASRRKHPPPE